MAVEKSKESKRGHRYFPVRVKLSAVRDRYLNELGYNEVLSKYGISGSTFGGWATRYKERVLQESRPGIVSLCSNQNEDPMSLKERTELEELRDKVARQNVLLEAHELMLELAKERFDIDVKKTTRRCYRKDWSRTKGKKRKNENRLLVSISRFQQASLLQGQAFRAGGRGKEKSRVVHRQASQD